MVHIHQYETPEFALHAAEPDMLADAESVIVSFAKRDGAPSVELGARDLAIDAEEGTITFALTQRQSARLPLGEVLVQVNVRYADSDRCASCEIPIEVRRNQHREVMT